MIVENRITPGMLEGVRPGFMTMFIPREAPADQENHFRRQLSRMSIKMSRLCEYNIEPTENEALHWCVVTRRVSVLNPSANRFAVLHLDQVSSMFDIDEAGRFMSNHFSDILDELSPDDIVEYPASSLRVAEYKVFGEIAPSSRLKSSRRLECDDDSGDFDEALPEELLEDRSDIKYSASISMPTIRPDDELYDDVAIDQAKAQWVEAMTTVVLQYMMQFHEAPPLALIEEQVRGRLQLQPMPVSPIVINGDMEIFLPGFNEMKIRMTPLARTIYILFLCHPEGIRLKDISDHFDELVEIYSMVKPGANEHLAHASIESLIDPFGDSLQQKLSMTRKAIRRQILVEDLAQKYMISGERGEPYRIAVSDVTLPYALRSMLGR